MRDFVLGQYYPAKSPVHALDPRTKILCAILTVVFIFVCGTFAGFALALAFVLFVTLCARIPVKRVAKSLKAVYFLIIFTFVLNVIFYSAGNELFSFWVIKITDDGLKRAAFMALRLILLIFGAGLLTFTATPIEITDGIESLLSPLKKIGFPAHEIAMMMSIALRFIPTLSEESDKIMKAQASRGAVFDEGSLIKRTRAVIALLVPLLVSSFRRADELAMAMEARCYHGGEGRTRLKELKMKKGDAAAFAVVAVFCTLMLADKIILTGILPFLAG